MNMKWWHNGMVPVSDTVVDGSNPNIFEEMNIYIGIGSYRYRISKIEDTSLYRYRYPQHYLKDFSSKNLRLLFVRGVVSPCQQCQRLNQQPAFLLSISPSSSSTVNGPQAFCLSLVMCYLVSQQQSLHLLCVANHQPSASQLLFFSPLLSQLTWIDFNNISIFWTANIHLPSVQLCRLTISVVFPPSGPHA
ncbi:hypothetical protein OUZ56_015934 [Daphnia magna]|uniref:Uncharacterized protein n=1 Tax=Daphnia magna TaxID=35525 RepID=A0ABR0AP66_9CRUS|nr:hypothetical protein OUZ56_015934 [Daphnia magna]